MKKPIRYEEKPFGAAVLGKRVSLADLPSPAAIAAANQTRKVTLAVSETALAFFKQEASRLGMPYQVMIRHLLDDYSAKHAKH